MCISENTTSKNSYQNLSSSPGPLFGSLKLEIVHEKSFGFLIF